MTQILIAAWAVSAGVGLSGCSNRYDVNLDEVRQHCLPTADEPQPQGVKRVTTRSARPNIPEQGDLPATSAPNRANGSIGKTRAIYRQDHDTNEPWPDVGTPEWERIHAAQADREKRIEQLLRSICRGC
jgi:hypothetical protein